MKNPGEDENRSNRRSDDVWDGCRAGRQKYRNQPVDDDHLLQRADHYLLGKAEIGGARLDRVSAGGIPNVVGCFSKEQKPTPALGGGERKTGVIDSLQPTI